MNFQFQPLKEEIQLKRAGTGFLGSHFFPTMPVIVKVDHIFNTFANVRIFDVAGQCLMDILHILVQLCRNLV